MTQLKIYHLCFAFPSGIGHVIVKCASREKAIGVAKVTAELKHAEGFSVREGSLDNDPFFVKEVI